ncbi:MAG: Omp28-related outer membrane protein [bacterium]|nr:Omp28-related outer membrane protein [bacterium]
MKKATILLSSLIAVSSVNAQIFSDDFEGYNAGDYIGPPSTEWTTWSGTEGGAEDAQVTTAQASSGTNSIYFSSTSANGGPQDVILDFGQQYTSGVFVFESDFYVDAGNNGYFNFQGTPTPGTTWSLNCNMADGIVSLDDGVTADLALGTYTPDTWFTLRIEANLSTGRWQASMDGVCFGVWANSVNEIASLDLFPINGSSFYVDDISFDHTTYTPAQLNATITGYSFGGIIAGKDENPSVTVANTGTDAITSFDVEVQAFGSTITENVTGVNLAAGQSMVVDFSSAITTGSTEESTTATISNINGGTDGDATDNDACAIVSPVIPAPGKVVVGEEATGTWCPWCTRGTVFMDRYEEDFGEYWAGIAVHNNDPMVVTDYDASIGPLIGGYPSALVDRGADVDPSAMSTDFYTRLQTMPVASINNSSTWNAATRELSVTVEADFTSAANSNYRLACVLTEDGVTGTGSGYDQANAYAGGGNGPMGGYELLPNPVPASQMVYDHVARDIAPDFDGDPNSFPATVNAGEQHSVTFTFTIPQEWNVSMMHIIGLLIDPNGRIDNAGKSMIDGLSSLDEVSNDQSFRMYPNPSSEVTVIEADLAQDAEITLTLTDMAGKVVDARDYGMVTPGTKLPIATSALESGVYIVQLTVNGKLLTKQLVVE